MAAQQFEFFDFDAEFALLDIGATSSMIRAGGIRPTLLTFTASAGVEAIALDWNEEQGPERAFEEARRYARDLEPVAYAFIAHLTRNGATLQYHLPGSRPSPANEFLAVGMFAQDGGARGLLYPVKRSPDGVSFGMPLVTDHGAIDWCPIGDLWNNPFCVGDVVRFRPRERAVDPTKPLWNAIVELTRMRIHEDQAGSEEYMAFLDDLRNGIFVVAGRSTLGPDRVLVRPRTQFNPLGTLRIDPALVTLADAAPADVERIGVGEAQVAAL